MIMLDENENNLGKLELMKQALENKDKYLMSTGNWTDGVPFMGNHNKLKLVEGKSLDLEEIKMIIKEIKEQMTLAMDRLEALEREIK